MLRDSHTLRNLKQNNDLPSVPSTSGDSPMLPGQSYASRPADSPPPGITCMKIIYRNGGPVSLGVPCTLPIDTPPIPPKPRVACVKEMIYRNGEPVPSGVSCSELEFHPGTETTDGTHDGDQGLPFDNPPVPR